MPISSDLRLEVLEPTAKLRKSRSTTQVELAKTLGTTQANVSRTELQKELYLTTLRSYVQALGGDLKLTAVFDDGEIPIKIRSTAA